jgi:hypothetical protein
VATENQQQLKPVLIEGARIIFRNFKVILPDEVAAAMEADGWNVKYLKPNEEEQDQGIERGPAWLPVEAAFDKGRPPKIVLITSRGKTNVTEDTVEQLDWVDVAVDDETGAPKCDMIVRPYSWTNAMGASGIKAYLKSMFVTIEEDELERKYAEMDEQ